MIGRKVRIFIISDSQLVKKMAIKSFGPLLLNTTLSKAQPLHVYESLGADAELNRQAKAMRLVVADMHLFSLAHIHVISQKSGLGQKAAFLSTTRNKLFITPESNRTHIFIGDMGTNCTPVSIVDIVSQWSGI